MAAFCADHDIFAEAVASAKKMAEKVLIASVPTLRTPTTSEASEKRVVRRTVTNVSPKQSSSKACGNSSTKQVKTKPCKHSVHMVSPKV